MHRNGSQPLQPHPGQRGGQIPGKGRTQHAPPHGLQSMCTIHVLYTCTCNDNGCTVHVYNNIMCMYIMFIFLTFLGCKGVASFRSFHWRLRENFHEENTKNWQSTAIHYWNNIKDYSLSLPPSSPSISPFRLILKDSRRHYLRYWKGWRLKTELWL